MYVGPEAMVDGIDRIKRAVACLAEDRREGSSVDRGMLYHDLPFAELAGMAAHRKGNRRRFRLVASRYDFSGRFGVDLGCSVGGLTFRAALAGASAVGVDYDPAAIAVANAVRDWRASLADQLSANATFVCADVVEYAVPECDFCIWLDNFMWVWKLRGRDAALAKLAEVSRRCGTLFFATAFGAGDGMAGGVVDTAPRAMLSAVFRDVEDLGVPRGRWHRRSIFMCRGPR